MIGALHGMSGGSRAQPPLQQLRTAVACAAAPPGRGTHQSAWIAAAVGLLKGGSSLDSKEKPSNSVMATAKATSTLLRAACGLPVMPWSDHHSAGLSPQSSTLQGSAGTLPAARTR